MWIKRDKIFGKRRKSQSAANKRAQAHAGSASESVPQAATRDAHQGAQASKEAVHEESSRTSSSRASQTSSCRSDSTQTPERIDAPLQQTPTQKKSIENQLRLLYWISRFGWLTAPQLGRLCWQNIKDPTQMARKTLRLLKTKGHVLARQIAHNVIGYVITTSGAEMARFAGNEDARPGTDLLRERNNQAANQEVRRKSRRSTWYHRWISNEYLIQQLIKGYTVVTEYEIQSKLSPLADTYRHYGHRVEKGWLGKVPDGLILHQERDGTCEWIWLEAEVTRKKVDDNRALADFIVYGLRETTIMQGKHNLHKVVLAYAHDDSEESLAAASNRLKILLRAVNRTLDVLVEAEGQYHREQIRKAILTRLEALGIEIRAGLKVMQISEPTALGNWPDAQNQ